MRMEEGEVGRTGCEVGRKVFEVGRTGCEVGRKVFTVSRKGCEVGHKSHKVGRIYTKWVINIIGERQYVEFQNYGLMSGEMWGYCCLILKNRY